MSSYTVFLYKKLDNIMFIVVIDCHEQTFAQSNVESCPICLNDLNDKTLRKTYCGHIFCKSCIYKWVGSHSSTCPACRTKINKYNVAEPYDSFLDSNTDQNKISQNLVFLRSLNGLSSLLSLLSLLEDIPE